MRQRYRTRWSPGTGPPTFDPLVDPGFEGKLLIPIHNLTNNTYYFKGGDGFIWIEFTKISPNKIWDQEYQKTANQHGNYVPFREDKIGQTSHDYFEKANNGNSIRNAIPATLVKVQKIADAAETQAGKAEKAAVTAKSTVRFYTIGGFLGIVAIIVAVYALIFNSINLSKDVSKTITEFREEYREHLAKENSSRAKIEALDGKIADIKLGDNTRDKIAAQQDQLNALSRQIDALQNELNRYIASQTE